MPPSRDATLHTSRYDAYGEKTDGTGSVSNKYRFAGEQYDSELGDYYLRARYYDADSGRFTRRDEYEGKLKEPLTLQKYIYANTNPVNFTDPSGLYTLDELGNFVHHEIGLHFQLQDPETHLNNVTIAQILKRVGRYRKGMSGNRKQPDLANLETKEIYEIKPENARKLGQRDIYTYLAKLHIVDKEWKAGQSYLPVSPLVIPQDPGSIYFTSPLKGDGVITYRRFNWKRPLEIIIYSSITIITLELIRRLALSQRTLGLA